MFWILSINTNFDSWYIKNTKNCEPLFTVFKPVISSGGGYSVSIFTIEDATKIKRDGEKVKNKNLILCIYVMKRNNQSVIFTVPLIVMEHYFIKNSVKLKQNNSGNRN